MTYTEYKAKLADAITQLMKYSTDKVGAGYYAEKAGKLEEDYPEYYERFEMEMDW